MDAKERLISAKQRRVVAVERVVSRALVRAADNFDQKAEDPGWEAEMNEEVLDDAIVEAAAAISAEKEARRACEGGT